MISWLLRQYTQMRALPKEPDRTFAGPEIAACKQCGNYLRVRFTLRLITHLHDDHKMDHNTAIETAIHVSERIYQMRKNRA